MRPPPAGFSVALAESNELFGQSLGFLGLCPSRADRLVLK